jgi:hypothetical protein
MVKRKKNKPRRNKIMAKFGASVAHPYIKKEKPATQKQPKKSKKVDEEKVESKEESKEEEKSDE